jgi:eukaryotic-like serine/threonine-protein kinase
MAFAPVNPNDVVAGKYRVERILGAGAMGVVVLATHLQLDGQVALKFLLPEAYGNPAMGGRFLREARLAVKLRSEHAARVIDVGALESGAPYIVMEYLQGEDLNQILRRSGPMEIATAAELVIQACDAVAEAHALGIVHRDLKPSNLFLTRRPDGTPLLKVLDFGISKTTAPGEADLGLTRTAAVLGSPHYMSPEQMRSSKDADARSDVWSLGVTLYQLLTARLPFDADTLGGLMTKVLQEEPAPLAVHRPDVPPPIAALVARCLQRERSRRAASVAEIASALAPYAPARAHPIAERIAALLGDSGRPSCPALATSAAIDASPAAPAATGRARGWTIALVVAAALAILGSLGAWRLVMGWRAGRAAPLAVSAVTPQVDSSPPVPASDVAPAEPPAPASIAPAQPAPERIPAPGPTASGHGPSRHGPSPGPKASAGNAAHDEGPGGRL